MTASIGTTPGGDGLIAAAKAGVLAMRDRNVAERQRIERLISRHRRTLEGIAYIGTREVLTAAGRLLADRINEAHGTRLEAEVNGPYGMAPDWYLTLRSVEDASWAIVRIVGGPERLTIKSESERGPGRPFPDDLSELVALFERQHVEDEAEKAAAAEAMRRED
jgi:hypothetical protein